MVAGHATLEEVENKWSIIDLADYHEAADIMAEINRIETDRINARAKKR